MSCDRCSCNIDEDFEACKNSPCSHRESFYAENLKKEIENLKCCGNCKKLDTRSSSTGNVVGTGSLSYVCTKSDSEFTVSVKSVCDNWKSE